MNARGRSRDAVLNTWVLLREQRYSREQAAARLGMTAAAFKRALQRAHRDGDPRALPALNTCSCGATLPANRAGRPRRRCSDCKRETRREWSRTQGAEAVRRYRRRQRGEYVPDRRQEWWAA